METKTETTDKAFALTEEKEGNHSDINLKTLMSFLFLTGIKEGWLLFFKRVQSPRRNLEGS